MNTRILAHSQSMSSPLGRSTSLVVCFHHTDAQCNPETDHHPLCPKTQLLKPSGLLSIPPQSAFFLGQERSVFQQEKFWVYSQTQIHC